MAVPLRIAILGATSQIAMDYILLTAIYSENNLSLFARRPDAVTQWLDSRNIATKYDVADFSKFGTNGEFDLIINFVGSGNPAQIAAIGASILDATMIYDNMALEYIKMHPECRYIFMSSGAVYGSQFDQPVDEKSIASVAVNNLCAQNWYAIAKLYAECRHRSLKPLNIVDIRIFNYFSHTQDTSTRFLITEILRATYNRSIFITTPDNIVRDYISGDDLYQLITKIIDAQPANDVVDIYTKAPVDKLTLLESLHTLFGLTYEIKEAEVGVNATGPKLNYYSKNRHAEVFGYTPSNTSLENIVREFNAAINNNI